MQTKLTYRVFALVMAALMFTSTVGFSVDMHICQDKLKSFNIFGTAKSCYDLAGGVQVKKCTKHNVQSSSEDTTSFDRKNCCQNKIQLFQSEENQQLQSQTIKLSNPIKQFITAFSFVYLFNFSVIDTQSYGWLNYTPPLITRDFSALFQSFLL